MKYRLFAAARGAVAGVLLGLLLDTLGVKDVVGAPFDLWLAGSAGVGALLGLLERGLWLEWGVGLATVFFLLVAFTPMMDRAAQPLVRRDPIPQHVDAILVLSAGVTGAGTLNPDATDRLLTGLELHRRFPTADLGITHIRSKRKHWIVGSAADQQRLIRLVDDKAHVFPVDSVHSTHDEAVQLMRIGQRRGWKHVLLVTTPTHTQRACMVFERIGFQVTCVPSRSSTVDVRGDAPTDRLLLFQQWLYETMGWGWYRIRGWV